VGKKTKKRAVKENGILNVEQCQREASRERERVDYLLVVPMGTGGSFPGGKAAGA
jgi:hypothetical protein